MARYLSIRVSELDEPFIPSVKRPCSICGEDIWVSKLMSGVITRDRKPVFICTVCFDGARSLRHVTWTGGAG